MLALAAESTPSKVSQALTRAIAQTMLADLCFLIYLTENKSQFDHRQRLRPDPRGEPGRRQARTGPPSPC